MLQRVHDLIEDLRQGRTSKTEARELLREIFGAIQEEERRLGLAHGEAKLLLLALRERKEETADWRDEDIVAEHLALGDLRPLLLHDANRPVVRLLGAWTHRDVAQARTALSEMEASPLTRGLALRQELLEARWAAETADGLPLPETLPPERTRSLFQLIDDVVEETRRLPPDALQHQILRLILGEAFFWLGRNDAAVVTTLPTSEESRLPGVGLYLTGVFRHQAGARGRAREAWNAAGERFPGSFYGALAQEASRALARMQEPTLHGLFHHRLREVTVHMGPEGEGRGRDR